MDIIKFKILEDGTISTNIEEISQINHYSADELMALIEDIAGGKVEIKKKEHAFWQNRTVAKGGKITVNK